MGVGEPALELLWVCVVNSTESGAGVALADAEADVDFCAMMSEMLRRC